MISVSGLLFWATLYSNRGLLCDVNYCEFREAAIWDYGSNDINDVSALFHQFAEAIYQSIFYTN